ncbi:MAG TPA: heme-binding protein [Bacteroidia bacterium]|nr:heme-binding protein [Bacteroidia bacterium]HNP99991.1 heme-binding protein [Bacteroidia bacterium]
MSKLKFSILIAAWITLFSIAAEAQVKTRATLTLDAARKIADAAVSEAKKNNAGGSIAIVDDGGNLIYLVRIDGTFSASAEVAIGKAQTAAHFKKPTSVFEDVITKGRVTMNTLPAVTPFTPLQGGVPIVYNGEILGAVGVSGSMSAQQDEQIANAAVQIKFD